ncbi:MAG: hypothetical protein OXT68_16195 [Chloroflexota bacterium]|nr:hypothetical protein [Chloroflexota bacterium]
MAADHIAKDTKGRYCAQTEAATRAHSNILADVHRAIASKWYLVEQCNEQTENLPQRRRAHREIQKIISVYATFGVLGG